jgi:hypothetical protein
MMAISNVERGNEKDFGCMTLPLANVSDDERWVLNGGRLRIFKSLPRRFRQHGGPQLWMATIRRA